MTIVLFNLLISVIEIKMSVKTSRFANLWSQIKQIYMYAGLKSIDL